MSLLPSGTFASLNNPYYGSGGGGGSLTSPVAITGNPEAEIDLTSATTQSIVQLASGTSNTWQIFTDTGVAQNYLLFQKQNAPNSGQTFLGLYSDTSGVTVGCGVAGGAVQVSNSMLVTDPLGGSSNGIVISPQSGTVNKISGTVASSGSLRLGSSVATSAIVNISDTGSNTGNLQVGGNGGDPLLVQGGSLVSNYSVIRPGVNTGGQLYLGSSTNGSPTAINITDTATTISKLGGQPQNMLSPQTIVSGASVNVPLPVGEGLYAIVGCGFGLAATAQTRQAQFSCMAYINSAGNCQMGGSAAVDVGALGGSDTVSLQVNPAATAFTLYNNGPQSLVAFQVSAFKISGPIPGVV